MLRSGWPIFKSELLERLKCALLNHFCLDVSIMAVGTTVLGCLVRGKYFHSVTQLVEAE